MGKSNANQGPRVFCDRPFPLLLVDWLALIVSCPVVWSKQPHTHTRKRGQNAEWHKRARLPLRFSGSCLDGKFVSWHCLLPLLCKGQNSCRASLLVFRDVVGELMPRFPPKWRHILFSVLTRTGCKYSTAGDELALSWGVSVTHTLAPDLPLFFLCSFVCHAASRRTPQIEMFQ